MPNEAQKMIEAQTDAASGMLKALRFLVESDECGNYEANQSSILGYARDAIREAEAAGIVAADC